MGTLSADDLAVDNPAMGIGSLQLVMALGTAIMQEVLGLRDIRSISSEIGDQQTSTREVHLNLGGGPPPTGAWASMV